MAVEWTEELAVGHHSIDAQHRELIRRFDDLLEACRARRGREKIEELFHFLDRYAKTHFALEEELMHQHGFPGTDEHVSQHHYFMRKLKAMKADLEAGGPSSDLVIRTNQVLLTWFLRHIKNSDVRLGAFVRLRTTKETTGRSARPEIR